MEISDRDLMEKFSEKIILIEQNQPGQIIINDIKDQRISYDQYATGSQISEFKRYIIGMLDY